MRAVLRQPSDQGLPVGGAEGSTVIVITAS